MRSAERFDGARRRRRGLIAGAALVAAGALGAEPAQAQMPDTFTNLQHFPEDISRGELIGHMRQFSFALGVRCQYCHTGGDGVSFEGVDFASDEKGTKRRARAMLEMVQTINSTILPELPERRSPAVAVECRTCHHGLPRPRMVDDLLRERIDDEGVESAVAWYDEIREETYGGWSYDFGEWVINDLAQEYFSADNPQVAAALMRMNSRYHGESVSVWSSLGEAEFAAGNREEAIAAFERALELSPDNTRLQERLEQIRSGG